MDTVSVTIDVLALVDNHVTVDSPHVEVLKSDILR